MLRGSPWLQIALGYAVLEAAFWTEHRAQAIASLVAAIVIIALIFLDSQPASELGLHLPRTPRALWSVAIAVIVGGVLALVAVLTGSIHELYGSAPIPEHLLAYFLWALVQQFILQSFFYVRVAVRFGDSLQTVVITAALFSIAHIPNPVLVPATFAGGLFFCEFFRRHRSIYPLAIAHALLGLAVAISVPDRVLHHMRIGIAYFHYGIGG